MMASIDQSSISANFCKKISDFYDQGIQVISRICVIALTALSYLAQLTLFYSYPNLAFLGLIIGFFFDKQTADLVSRVNRVFDSCKTKSEKFLLIGIGGFISLYSLPYSIIAVTLYQSAHWGEYISQSSEARLKRYTAGR